MRRYKVLFGVLTAAIVVGGISYAGYSVMNSFVGTMIAVAYRMAGEYDDLSRPILVDLAEKGWRPEAVKRYATADYAATLEKSPGIFDRLNELGKVTSVSSSLVVQTHETGRNGIVETKTAAVARDVSFENGDRRVELDFLWQDKQWRLTGVQAIL